MLARLLEIIVLLLVIRAAWRVVGGMITISAGAPRRTTTRGGPSPVKLVRDPVCGTYVSPGTAISDGRNYFCSEKCRNEYRAKTVKFKLANDYWMLP